MMFEGYKYSVYDATYRKAMFNVNERGEESRVLEITDVDSGQTFIVDFRSGENERKNSIRTWRKHDQGKERKGKYLHFGSKGILEELKYSGRKHKQDI